MEIQMASWSPVNPPSLLALIPLLVYIVLMFRGKGNITGLLAGIGIAVIMMGIDLKTLAQVFQDALGSTTAMIGLIILAGSGLGLLMNRAGITQTLVYWIVKIVGVNTPNKAKFSLIISSIIICGLLGTLGGGNAIIAPILLPIMASLAVPPTVVGVLFKTAGEIGLMVGPLTGVTLITMEVTGLNYGQLMLYAVIPFSIVWLIGTWIGTKRIEKDLIGKEDYHLDADIPNIDAIHLSDEQKRSTIIFLIGFLALVVYGVLSKQGTNYAFLVMVLLALLVTVVSRMNADESIGLMVKGMASQFEMMVIFICLEVLLTLVSAGGGFDALGNWLGSLAAHAGSFGVYIVASLVGGFGIEAAAVAEIKIIYDMFGQLAMNVGLPMSVFATCILAATRLTGSMYPTSNFAGQMGIAHSSNTKDGLRALWISVGLVWAWVVVWGLVGPMLFN